MIGESRQAAPGHSSEPPCGGVFNNRTNPGLGCRSRRRRRATSWCVPGLVCVLGCPPAARAQATGQLWGNATIDWLATRRLTLEIDVEPKAQLVVHAGQARWFDVDATPHVDYAMAPWIDALGEAEIGFKYQGNDVHSMTITPRVGLQLHILSRLLRNRAAGRGSERESLPKRRSDTRTLLRFEHLTTTSSTVATTTSSRFRGRIGLAYPLNRPKTTSDGAVYLTSDSELFVPVDGETPNRRVSELRIRTGIGYRPSFAWRFEALYVGTAERTDTSGAMALKSHALDIRVRRQF